MFGPELAVDGHAVSVLGVATLGVVVGYVAGLFGLGGGFLMTPLLVALFGVPLPVAVGTGLCQMVGTSMVAFLRHRRVGQGEARFDLLMVPGSLIGVELGARVVTGLERIGDLRLGGHTLPWVTAVVQPCYVVLLAWVALGYWRHGARGSRVDLDTLRPGPLARARLGPRVAFPAAGLASVSAMLVSYIGLGLGFLSGLLGIGGGVALNPILLYGYGFPIRQAVGTGILALFVTALVGTALHASRGHVHLPLALTMLVGGTLAAQLGALASRRLSGRALGRIHAVVLVAAIAAVVWDLARELR
jgi:hypothetical protein